MAKITLGMLAGSISGAIGSTVFSHNRGGAYIRNRTIPVKSTTPYSDESKADFTAASQAWSALTEAQREAWRQWAAGNPITDVLGASRQLAGNAAFTMLAARLLRIGSSMPTTPPTEGAPPSLTTLVFDGDIGAGDFDLTYTGTPLAANHRLYLYGCTVPTQSKRYVENLYRQFNVSDAEQASPYDIQTAFTTRFGAPVVGQYCHCKAFVVDDATGLISAPQRASVVVSTT